MIAGGLSVRGFQRLRGPFASVSGVPGAALYQMVTVERPDGSCGEGRVVAITGDTVVIEVLGATAGLDLTRSTVHFCEGTATVGVGVEMFGRVFDARGHARDGLPEPVAVEHRSIDGMPINPVRREPPADFLETGLSAIDGLNTLTLGQKLPIFTEAGLPHDRIARTIVEGARAPGVERFAVVFAGLGLPREVAAEYEAAFHRAVTRRRTIVVLSLAGESATARLMAPRTALTMAEYLAFDLGMHVLVVMSDVTHYGEALREVAAGRGELPSRKGYPGYLGSAGCPARSRSCRF